MNSLVTATLIAFAVAWLFYIAGARDRRFAFVLWFPFTATVFFGAILWLWAGLEFLINSSGSGEAYGFAALGALIALGTLLVCPVLLIISFWQRPKMGAYGLSQTIPVIVLYLGLVALYRPFSEKLDNQQLQLVVLDTKMNPISNAKVIYRTNQRSNRFAFPSSSMSGEVKTDANGSVLLPVPKTHAVNIRVSLDGYAKLQVRMDRNWGSYTWHQTSVSWQFPPENPNEPWKTHGGSVQTDVDNSALMHLTVFLPKSRVDAIPNYGPVRVVHQENGKQTWTTEPSTIHAQ